MVVLICRSSPEGLAVAEGHGHGSSLCQLYCLEPGDLHFPPAIWCEATWPPGFSLPGSLCVGRRSILLAPRAMWNCSVPLFSLVSPWSGGG